MRNAHRERWPRRQAMLKISWTLHDLLSAVYVVPAASFCLEISELHPCTKHEQQQFLP